MAILSNLFAAHTVFYILSFIHLYTGLSTALKGGCLWGPGIASLEEYICVDMLKLGNRNSTSSVSQLATLFRFAHKLSSAAGHASCVAKLHHSGGFNYPERCVGIFLLPAHMKKRLLRRFFICAGRGNRNPVF